MTGYTRVNMDSGRDIHAKIITVCKDIADSMDNGDRIEAIVLDFSKAFDLVPYNRLPMKSAIWGMDSRVVAWVREFLLGRKQSQSRRANFRGS
jgi:hypothetical protein